MAHENLGGNERANNHTFGFDSFGTSDILVRGAGQGIGANGDILRARRRADSDLLSGTGGDAVARDRGVAATDIGSAPAAVSDICLSVGTRCSSGACVIGGGRDDQRQPVKCLRVVHADSRCRTACEIGGCVKAGKRRRKSAAGYRWRKF